LLTECCYIINAVACGGQLCRQWASLRSNKWKAIKAFVLRTRSTLIIISNEKYQEKPLDFINDNSTTANRDLTKDFQKEIRKTISECQILIQKQTKWRLGNLTPRPPPPP
jgi:hypothetical protein